MPTQDTTDTYPFLDEEFSKYLRVSRAERNEDTGCRWSAKRSSLTGRHKCHIHPMENVTLTQKEQARLQVLNSLLAEHMALDQAATLMGVTTRHTRRILAAYRERGAAAVAHGHRGRRPANATPDAVVAGVVRLARTRYEGANHTHLSELLSPNPPKVWRYSSGMGDEGQGEAMVRARFRRLCHERNRAGI